MSDVNFTDLTGFGKGLDKLLSVLSKAVGRITKAHFERKDIETKQREILAIAQSKADAAKLLAKTIKEIHGNIEKIDIKHSEIEVQSLKNAALNTDDTNLEIRALANSTYRNAVKQLNTESVTAIAAELLIKEKNISDDPVDEDWITRFFSIVEDISSEEMQLLWGKILAGEIKQPNSFSFRTLNVIRNLSKDEAETIMKVANFAFEHNRLMYLLKGNKVIMKNIGLVDSDTNLLFELGLLNPNYEFEFVSRNKNIYLLGDKLIHGRAIDNIPHYNFTKLGNEILKLITINPPLEYLQYFDSFFGRFDQLEYKSTTDLTT